MSDALRIALVGNPNCGKTSLFNHLTGTRQKVANYAGVTVERKVGQFTLPFGKPVRVLDLPGTYSLDATSPDEAITRDVVQGKSKTAFRSGSGNDRAGSSDSACAEHDG